MDLLTGVIAAVQEIQAAPLAREVEHRLIAQNGVHATGTIRALAPASAEQGDEYACVVRVVKIGIDSATSTRIDELRRKYRQFTYDSTFNQLYNAERFDMYRDLGFDSTSQAIRAKIAENSCTTSDLTKTEEPSDQPAALATAEPRDSLGIDTTRSTAVMGEP